MKRNRTLSDSGDNLLLDCLGYGRKGPIEFHLKAFALEQMAKFWHRKVMSAQSTCVKLWPIFIDTGDKQHSPFSKEPYTPLVKNVSGSAR